MVEQEQAADGHDEPPSRGDFLAPPLRKEPPYWHSYKTFAKERWYGRQLVEIFTTEFRDRTKDYYIWAIHNGVCNINDKIALPTHIVKNSDMIVNTVHRHEPPVTAEPIRILYRNEEEGRLVVVKPGSFPVHAGGRYYKHTLLEIIKKELNVPIVYTANRLDRLTSGLMVCSTNLKAAKQLGGQFQRGEVRKAYVCRVKGRFPEQEIVCDKPILGVDRQCGVNIVHPLGKDCETIFNFMSYDEQSDSSVVFCRPITGRTHQIRVHVQYLGYPILNDPIYNHKIWLKMPPTLFPAVDIGDKQAWKTEAGGGWENVHEVSTVVEALKKDQDDREDWARWRDEVLFRELNQQAGYDDVHVPGLNASAYGPEEEERIKDEKRKKLIQDLRNANIDTETAFARRVRLEDKKDHCEECKIPLLPDPRPEDLFIYLHAIKYETDEWSYEDQLPWWAHEDWRTRAPASHGDERVVQATMPQADNSVLPRPLVDASYRVERDKRVAEKVVPDGKKLPPLYERAEAPIIPLLEVPEVPLSVAPQSPLDLVTSPELTPALAIEVFEGMEAYAQRDIQQCIAAELALLSLDAPTSQVWTRSAHTSSLVLVSAGLPSFAALRLYTRGALLCADRAHVVLSEARLPTSLLNSLRKERIELGWSRRKRRDAIMAHRKAERRKNFIANGGKIEEDGVQKPPPGGRKAKKATDEVPDLADLPIEPEGPTTSEVELIEFVNGVWDAQPQKRNEAYEGWVKLMEHLNPEIVKDGRVTLDHRRFRASVDRSAYLFPTMVTTDVARHVGDKVGKWYNAADDAVGSQRTWSVNLRDPVVEVTLKFSRWIGVPVAEIAKLTSDAPDEDEAEDREGEGDDEVYSQSNQPGSILHLLSIPSSLVTPAVHRRQLPPELLQGGTALARYRSHLLSLILPVPVAQDAAPVRIHEPCVGTGSLAIELAASLARRGIRAELLASDIDPVDVEHAREASALCGFPDDEEVQGVRMRFGCVDATEGEGLREFAGGPVDAILTDLPWGKRILTRRALPSLYASLLGTFNDALRPGGHALLVTAENNLLRRTVEDHRMIAKRAGRAAYLDIVSLPHIAPARAPQTEDTAAATQTASALDKLEGLLSVTVGYHVHLFLLRKVEFDERRVVALPPVGVDA